MFYHSRSSLVRSRVVVSAYSSRTHLCYYGTLLTPSFRHRSFRVYLNVCWGKLCDVRRPLDQDWRTSECHKPFCLHCTLQHSIRNKHTLQSMPSQLCREPVVLWEDHSLAFDVLWTWKLHAFTATHHTHTNIQIGSSRMNYSEKLSLLLSLILMLASPPPPIITPLQGHITLIPTTWCIPSHTFFLFQRRMDILF